MAITRAKLTIKLSKRAQARTIKMVHPLIRTTELKQQDKIKSKVSPAWVTTNQVLMWDRYSTNITNNTHPTTRTATISSKWDQLSIIPMTSLKSSRDTRVCHKISISIISLNPMIRVTKIMTSTMSLQEAASESTAWLRLRNAGSSLLLPRSAIN